MGRKLRCGSAVPVAVVLLLAAGSACGGDDDDDVAPGAAPGDGPLSFVSDACSVITVAEVEEQFGDRGSVSDTREADAECAWRVGNDPHNGLVQIFGMPIPDEQSLVDAMTVNGRYEDTSVPVDVEGAPDVEARVEPDGTVYFRSQGRMVSVSAYFRPKVDGQGEKLMALAELALRRLEA